MTVAYNKTPDEKIFFLILKIYPLSPVMLDETLVALCFGVALQVHNIVKFNVILYYGHATQSSLFFIIFPICITFYLILFS